MRTPAATIPHYPEIAVAPACFSARSQSAPVKKLRKLFRRERIADPNAKDLLPVVQIFGIENGGTASRRGHNH